MYPKNEYLKLIEKKLEKFKFKKYKKILLIVLILKFLLVKLKF